MAIGYGARGMTSSRRSLLIRRKLRTSRGRPIMHGYRTKGGEGENYGVGDYRGFVAPENTRD